MASNVQGTNRGAQQDLAWIAQDRGTPLLAERMLVRQQQAAKDKKLLDAQNAKLLADKDAKTQDLFKNGPHDAGGFQGYYNDNLYKPFMGDTFNKVRQNTVNPNEVGMRYGTMGADAAYLKEQSTRLDQNLEARKTDNPNYNWGLLKDNAYKIAVEDLANHTKGGMPLSTFNPNYDNILQRATTSSNAYMGPKIGKSTIDNGLTGTKSMDITFQDAKGNTTTSKQEIPAFAILGKNKAGHDQIIGFDYPMIEKAFVTQPGGDGYMKMRENELYTSDPNYKAKFDAFSLLPNAPQKIAKLRYESIIKPVIGDPLATKKVALSRSTELAKTSDDDLEEMQYSKPTWGQFDIRKSDGNTEVKLPLASFQLPQKQFEMVKNGSRQMNQQYLKNGVLTRVPDSEARQNTGLADPRVNVVTIPILRNQNIYYKGKDGVFHVFNTGKKGTETLTPEILDKYKSKAEKDETGSIYISTEYTGTGSGKRASGFIPVTSGKDILDRAIPGQPWVKYTPFAELTMQGMQGGFPTPSNPALIAAQKKYDNDVLIAKMSKKPIPELPAALKNQSDFEAMKFQGKAAYSKRLVPLSESPTYWMTIKEMINRNGGNADDFLYKELPQKTYQQMMDQYNGPAQPSATPGGYTFE